VVDSLLLLQVQQEGPREENILRKTAAPGEGGPTGIFAVSRKLPPTASGAVRAKVWREEKRGRGMLVSRGSGTEGQHDRLGKKDMEQLGTLTREGKEAPEGEQKKETSLCPAYPKP